MEMVAAAKMRKAVDNVLASRDYSTLAWQMILDVSAKTEESLHPLLKERDQIKKVAIVLITSNRGLCGGFNQQVIFKTLEYIKEEKEKNKEVEIEVITVGKKGNEVVARQGLNITAAFEKSDVIKEILEITPISHLIIDEYLTGNYDRVALVYTDFVSTLKQVPRVKQLLPIEAEVDEMLGQVGEESREHKNIKTQEQKRGEEGVEYLFEPSPRVILNDLLPRLLEVQVYQALLESNASEHSARMVAMRNANEAAGEMIEELTLTYNQVRQAAITKEIAEIVGGKMTLE